MLGVAELHLRAVFFQAIREFFRGHSFLEVDTPIRQPVVLPESNIEPLASGEWFLQASPELCMKRLLAAGSGNIFQICRCFRRNERGRRHLEEFVMLEWYRLGTDYHALMEDCEGLIAACLQALSAAGAGGRLRESEAGAVLQAPAPWRRTTVAGAFARHCPVELEAALAQQRFDELLVEHVEPQLGRTAPEFLLDYPAEMAALARQKPGAPEVAERFELYVRGVELANGFSELTDALEQRQRFAAELAAIAADGRSTGGMPERFLADLAKLGECAGIAFGLDRLFMLLLGRESIDEAVSFSPGDF